MVPVARQGQKLTGAASAWFSPPVQDFTILPMGYKIDGEVIVVCPYCHRSAVRRAIDERAQFVHLIRITTANETAKLDMDSCPRKGLHRSNLKATPSIGRPEGSTRNPYGKRRIADPISSNKISPWSPCRRNSPARFKLHGKGSVAPMLTIIISVLAVLLVGGIALTAYFWYLTPNPHDRV